MLPNRKRAEIFVWFKGQLDAVGGQKLQQALVSVVSDAP
jgi:hypothetical protein